MWPGARRRPTSARSSGRAAMRPSWPRRWRTTPTSGGRGAAGRPAPPDERAKFGQGSYEAIVAAEVADNANIGGALLPTLTLGIPGSAGAAAFMAALNLQGVRVGPLINQDHPGLLPYISGVLVLSNFVMYG